MIHSFFLYIYKNLFYKNVEAGIGQNFKNMLRTYPGWDFVKDVFILSNKLCEKKIKCNHLVRVIHSLFEPQMLGFLMSQVIVHFKKAKAYNF